MRVIKKDGRIEEFDLNKIKTSINNSARDAQINLNEGELRLISQDVERILMRIRGDEGLTSFLEISAALLRTLNTFGYGAISKTYEKSGNNFNFYTNKEYTNSFEKKEEVKEEVKEQVKNSNDDEDKTQLFRKF